MFRRSFRSSKVYQAGQADAEPPQQRKGRSSLFGSFVGRPAATSEGEAVGAQQGRGFLGWFTSMLRYNARSRSHNKMHEEEDAQSDEDHSNGSGHEFLEAFVSGDLSLLDACFKHLQEVHGPRSFVTLAGGSSLKLENWLRYFANTTVKQQVAKFLPSDCKATAAGKESMSRAFSLLATLTTVPRLEIQGSTGQEVAEGLRYSDFLKATEQIEHALFASVQLMPLPDSDDEFVRRSSFRSGHCVLGDAPPAYHLLLIAVMHARHAQFSSIKQDMRALWSLLRLEPVKTVRSCLSSQHPAAALLGELMCCLAEGVAADALCSEQCVEPVVLAFRFASELCQLHSWFARDKKATSPPGPLLLGQVSPKDSSSSPSKGRTTSRQGPRKTICQGPRKTVCQVPHETIGRFLQQPAIDSRSGRLVIGVIQAQSVKFAMGALLWCKSCEAAAALLSAAWDLLDRSGQPQGSAVRPLVVDLAAAAGIAAPAEPILERSDPTWPAEFPGMSCDGKSGSSSRASTSPGRPHPASARQAIEALMALVQGPRDAEIERQSCAALYGAPILAILAVEEHRRVFGDTNELSDCQAKAQELISIMENQYVSADGDANRSSSLFQKGKHFQQRQIAELRVIHSRRSLMASWQAQVLWQELSQGQDVVSCVSSSPSRQCSERSSEVGRSAP